eukprot:5315892-Amphidinium_carterae.1
MMILAGLFVLHVCLRRAIVMTSGTNYYVQNSAFICKIKRRHVPYEHVPKFVFDELYSPNTKYYVTGFIFPNDCALKNDY